MEKRYQVFISSTFTDLHDARQEIIQALLELNCIPSGMELFPAADEDQWTLIKRVIDDCDYYIVVVAGRYGSIGSEGKSYTQMEYEYAISKGKPVIAFPHRNPGALPASLCEATDEGKRLLAEFRSLIEKRLYKDWATPQELGSVVSRSLINLINHRPAIGWVRADKVVDESAAQIILSLKNRIEQLEAEAKEVRALGNLSIETLAQGKDILDIELTYEYIESGGRVSIVHKSVPTTWDDLLARIGPHLFAGCPEEEVAAFISDFTEELVTRISYNGQNSDRRSRFLCKDVSLQKIKLQLVALGVINVDNNWKLTEFGRSMVLVVGSIRR